MFRKLSIALALILISAVYAQTTVTWWDFLGGGDGIRMKKLIDDFNASHDDIKIDGTTLEWGPSYYTKVQTSAAVGEQPDIMTYHLSRYTLAIPTGVLRPFSEEELASVGLSTSDYNAAAMQAATGSDGQIYGVPLDIHAIVLYYNKEILGAAGLLDDNGHPNFTSSLEDFNAGMEKIKAAGSIPLAYPGDNGTTWRVAYSMIGQQGAQLLDENNKVAAIEELTNAVSAIRGWMDNGLGTPNTEYPAAIALFTSGEASMMLNGVWEVPTMVDLAAKGELFDWGAVEIPTWYAEPATWADSHAFAIPNSSAKPISDEKLAAVLEVIAWMSKNSLFWATAGHIPAYSPVTDSDDYKAMEPNATYAVLGEHAFFDPKSNLAGAAGSPLYDAVAQYLMPAVNGQLSVDEAIEMFVEDIDSQ
ncbi:MAG: extracellular solute-binding protein [Deinococcales bacterium]